MLFKRFAIGRQVISDWSDQSITRVNFFFFFLLYSQVLAAFYHHLSKSSIEKLTDFQKSQSTTGCLFEGLKESSHFHASWSVCHRLKVDFRHHSLQKANSLNLHAVLDSCTLVWLEFIKWPVSSWSFSKECHCFLRHQKANCVCVWLLTPLCHF